MKINQCNRYIVMFVIGLSFFVSGCREKSEVEKTEWFEYALKFYQTKNELMAKNLVKKFTLQDLNKMIEKKQGYLRVKQPTEAEIISVLKSPNRKFQRVGLVAMCLKPIETDQTIDILFEFLKDQDREFRWYAVASLEDFTKFPESKKESLGRQLFVINKSEKNEELFIRMFRLFAKFPCQEAVPLLTEQLMKEGKKMRSIGFLLLRH